MSVKKAFLSFILMWTIFKVFIDSLQYYFCFKFWFLALRHLES